MSGSERVAPPSQHHHHVSQKIVGLARGYVPPVISRTLPSHMCRHVTVSPGFKSVSFGTWFRKSNGVRDYKANRPELPRVHSCATRILRRFNNPRVWHFLLGRNDRRTEFGRCGGGGQWWVAPTPVPEGQTLTCWGFFRSKRVAGILR